MEIAIVLGLIYITTFVLNFVKKDWPTTWRNVLVRGHIIFAGLTVIQIILLTTKDLTFRGVYFDRIIFWGLFEVVQLSRTVILSDFLNIYYSKRRMVNSIPS